MSCCMDVLVYLTSQGWVSLALILLWDVMDSAAGIVSACSGGLACGVP